MLCCDSADVFGSLVGSSSPVVTGGHAAAGLAMARLRESSAGSFSTCSAMTGDDGGESTHDEVPVRVPCAPEATSAHRGGGDGAGRFGIYQGNWGGRRRAAQLHEITN